MSGKTSPRIARPLWLCGIGLLFWCAGSQADVPITVKATIIEPGCYIMGKEGAWTGQPGDLHDDILAIDFGEVPIADLGTSNAEKSASLWFECGVSSTNKTLNLYVKPTTYGAMPSLGNHVLATSTENLGIALSVSGHNITLNQWMPMTAEHLLPGDGMAQNKIIVTARLVAQGNPDELSGGQFQASASFILHYL